jgi:hypothetical protein
MSSRRKTDPCGQRTGSISKQEPSEEESTALRDILGRLWIMHGHDLHQDAAQSSAREAGQPGVPAGIL